MSNSSKISEAELEVMKLLWNTSPLSSSEIISSLSDKMDWSSQTIKTFINRLLNKKVISFEKSGRSYLYYPLISYDEYVKSENKSFLEKVYDGAIGMLFSKFLEEEKLSEKEIEKLQKILEEKKNELEE
ncbi:putative penicillinase repressor [Gottschalkia acidurici 9a]|uniref:Penicillinase repressor n=1 Tax=Gottschalkia acidurici (strain ATCC 7906 / DSM 604 / BCRC 14475 / CIP 104303 / KCTC 5404 / NCIMB 10678 / 9a) TaxID=1128398 RepID=K0B0X1_GOTA9|nr:BlaI/MecI/CopY family transcriptional regulator [Gottschalkia acidurici]AFS79668.1 putative penicillinase repressor [Gottschalkia acidurici 9a]